jgi:heme A synthase
MYSYIAYALIVLSFATFYLSTWFDWIAYFYKASKEQKPQWHVYLFAPLITAQASLGIAGLLILVPQTQDYAWQFLAMLALILLTCFFWARSSIRRGVW